MATVYGEGDYRYQVDPDWGRGPEGVSAFGFVSMVSGAPDGRVFVFQRLPDPQVMIFSPEGQLLDTWGKDKFEHPHGIWMSPDGTLYLTDRDTHSVTQWTQDGELLRTWGTPGQPGAPGDPFNEPTRAFATASGDVFVSDGYGQNRVHRFAGDGSLIRSWGETGSGPGQFNWPVHSVWVDSRDRVHIVDRGNDRVQRFSLEGEYIDEVGGVLFPNDLYITSDETIYIGEGGGFEGGGFVRIQTMDDVVLTRWGEKGEEPGQFANVIHGIWVDPQGDLYVSEVGAYDRIQKFIRV